MDRTTPAAAPIKLPTANTSNQRHGVFVLEFGKGHAVLETRHEERIITHLQIGWLEWEMNDSLLVQEGLKRARWLSRVSLGKFVAAILLRRLARRFLFLFLRLPQIRGVVPGDIRAAFLLPRDGLPGYRGQVQLAQGAKENTKEEKARHGGNRVVLSFVRRVCSLWSALHFMKLQSRGGSIDVTRWLVCTDGYRHVE